MVVTENKTGRKYKTVGRQKKIYFTASGEKAFFRYGNARIYLDEVLRTSYPIEYYKEYEGDIDGVIGGFLSFGYFGYYVEVLEGGECVQLFEEISE